MGQLALALPVFVTSATIPALLTMVDETMPWSQLIWCSLHASLFLGAVFSATFLLSSLLSEPNQIALFMLFFTTFQFSIYLVKTITHYSLFRLADIDAFMAIIKGGGPNWPLTIGLAVASLACLAGSLWAIERRVP